jgi:preprotein translocase subunit SecD
VYGQHPFKDPERTCTQFNQLKPAALAQTSYTFTTPTESNKSAPATGGLSPMIIGIIAGVAALVVVVVVIIVVVKKKQVQAGPDGYVRMYEIM